MPAPVVYVAAITGTVVTIAAIFAFKEFVYTPHIAPKVEVWRETRRQQKQARRAQPVAVPARQAPDSDDDELLIRRRGADREGSDDFGGMSVELRDLVANEQSEWQSSTGESTLRHRNVKSRTVLEESNVFLPYDPISPTTPTSAVSSGSSSPVYTPTSRSLYEMAQVSSAPVVHSPLPRTPVNASRLQTSVTANSLFSQAESTRSPRATSPTDTDISLSTIRSVSSASSHAPAVPGPASRSASVYLGSDFARSPTFSPTHNALGLAPRGAASSPFEDVDPNPLSPRVGHMRSPSPVLLSPPHSSLHFGAESDTAILSPSLRSAMFSPSMSSFDGHFDIDSSFEGSDDGSDASWNNVRN